MHAIDLNTYINILLPALAAEDGRVGDRLTGGSEAVAGGLVSYVRHVV